MVTGLSAGKVAAARTGGRRTPPAAVTKVLIPRRRPGTVRRRQLLDFLHRHLDRRLQLVVAPPGYGKTTLLVDFAHEAREEGLPVCWLTLDAPDADPRSFFEHLLLSLRQSFPGFGERTTALLRAVDDAAREHRAIATALANELAEQVEEFFLLVLDDYHTVGAAPEVNSAVDWLLQRLPEGCRVIIGGRTIPTQLNLVGLASRLDVAGLGVADLRFRPDEVAELMEAHDGYGVHPREAERAVSRAEGWITAIVLSLHAQESARFSGLLRAKSQQEPVYDYLATQLFDRLPSDLQDFLMAAAILPTLSAGECDAVLQREDSASRLEELVQLGLFVEPLESPESPESAEGEAGGGAGDWLRFHQLWRAFLLDRLLATNPQQAATLRRRAADRARQRGDVPQAVEHLLDLGGVHGDWSGAVALLLRQAESELAHGRAARLLGWIDRLPEAVADAEPLLHYHAARALRRLDRLTDSHARAERGEQTATAGRRWDALYLCRAWRAEMLAFMGRGDEAVAMVVELFDQFNRQPRPAELRVRLETEACFTLGFAGRAREAIARGQYVLDHLRQVRRVEERQQVAAIVHNVMGLCQRNLGDIAAAERHLLASGRLWGQLGNVAQQAGLLNNLARVRARAGRHQEADEAFQAGIDLAEGIGHLPAQVTVRASMARVQRERGDLLAAQETMERCLPLARQIDEAWLLGEALLEAGSIALELGRVVEATHYLEAATDTAQQTWPAGLAVSQALLALAFARGGRLGDAGETLALARKGVPQVRAPDERLRGSVAILAAEAALGGDALADLRAVRRWARDNGRQGAFFAECARYRESARLLLNERRLPNDVVSSLQAALAESRWPAPSPAASPMLRPVPRQAPETAFEIRLLGTPGLLRDGENVSSWRTNLVRELLFFLALRAGDVVRSEALVDALMPEGEFERSLTALRHAVYHLRRLFAPLNPVRTATGGYCLELDGEVRCDVQEFRRLVEAGRPNRAGVDVAALEGALSLYRGAFLEGVDADWVLQPRAELERLFLFAARSLLLEYERTGSHEAAVAVAERVLVIDPFLEPFHLALLRHQVALGHLAAARQHYRHYCRLMRDAFGREPDPAATSLLASPAS